MSSKRKTTSKGLFTKKNAPFIAAGVLATIAGVYFFAGDKIAGLFEKNNDMPDIIPPKEFTQGNGGGGGGGQLPKPSQPTESGIDLNKKLRKGSKGDEVKRLQYIINYIAGFRGTTSYKTPSGYTVKFPISTDGDFGSGTQAGAYFIAPSFKNDGFITLDTARKRLAYLAGYYQKPFPSELVDSKNYKVYQDQFKTGQIDFGKQDRAKKIGAFVNPFNP